MCARAWTFGQNAYGELGHGDVIGRRLPTAVRLRGGGGGTDGAEAEDVVDAEAEDVVDVAGGNELTALLDARGEVFVCGYNDSGQCGQAGAGVVLRPTRVRALVGHRITRIYGGNGSEHLAAVNEAGALFTFGYNGRGQLGHGTTTSTAAPTLVTALVGRPVVAVACSYFHTVIVTADGAAWATGRNDVGQLGTGDDRDRLVPAPVLGLEGCRVTAAACGQHHTVLALADGGGLVACGKNDHGQLGLGAPASAAVNCVVVPTHVALPSEATSIASLACGYYHTVAATDDGAVWAFGRNEYGQLGLGHQQHTPVPTVVLALARARITQVACGCYHTLALSDDGKVYPFGRNNHGQLGLESLQDCSSPQIIPSLRNEVVTRLAAGFYHSICIVAPPRGAHAETTGGRGSLSADLRRMLNNPQRSDVVFVVDGMRLHAHSCILMARCEPLEKMLDGRTKDGSLPELVIPDCSHEAFAALLEFLYTDAVASLSNANADTDFVLEVLALADQYLVTALRRMCEHCITRTLSCENVCMILEAASLRDMFKLKRRCLSFMRDHFAQVIATEAFVSLPPGLLQEVLVMASRSGVVIPNQQRDHGL